MQKIGIQVKIESIVTKTKYCFWNFFVICVCVHMCACVCNVCMCIYILNFQVKGAFCSRPWSQSWGLLNWIGPIPLVEIDKYLALAGWWGRWGWRGAVWAVQNELIASVAQRTHFTTPGSRMSSLSMKDSKTFRNNDSVNLKSHSLQGFLIRKDI